MTSDQIYKLIEDNGLQLQGDIEHFATLIEAAVRKTCAFDAEWCIQNSIEHHIPSRIRAGK
jgi:hypothetical protein